MFEEYDDYLEFRIHPEDLFNMKSMQISLSKFIYNQPIEERNNYKNIFSYRVLNAKGSCSRPHTMRATQYTFRLIL